MYLHLVRIWGQDPAAPKLQLLPTCEHPHLPTASDKRATDVASIIHQNTASHRKRICIYMYPTPGYFPVLKVDWWLCVGADVTEACILGGVCFDVFVCFVIVCAPLFV